jgi:hypothetical protein
METGSKHEEVLTGTAAKVTYQALEEDKVGPEPMQSTVQEPNAQLSEAGNMWIDDARFRGALRLLRNIQQVIVSENVKLDGDDQHLRLGNLQMLDVHPRRPRNDATRRRYPRPDEWQAVENKIIILARRLSDLQRRRVQLHMVAGFMLYGPIFLLGIAIVLLWVTLSFGSELIFNVCFILWLATLGALGSAAFIYVNALSIQIDPDVDVTSPPMVMMRVLLGALFGMILALPFDYQSFLNFVKDPTKLEAKEALLLLLPFVLGFSTPLVLLILNHLVQSVQTFFGVRPQPEAARSEPTPPNTDDRPVESARAG